MHYGLAVLILGAFAAPAADLVPEVRRAAARGQLAAAEQRLEGQGVTPEWVEAWSWLGRGALAAGSLDQAASYAAKTRELALDMLRGRTLERERRLATALGAAIEVHAQTLDRRGERGEAVAFLREELARWRGSPIHTRIQKNLHLLDLEGKPAPPLEGAPPEMRGRPVLLFFWAHWCGDCKRMAEELAKVREVYGPKGLLVVAPTQTYGYVARGRDAEPEEETRYIDEVRRLHFAALDGVAAPLSQENFRNYGVSTTPTIVVVDREGLVRLYHPGAMRFADLSARLSAALAR